MEVLLIPNRCRRFKSYKAIWLSHSSIGDYEKCPKLYYLHNIYKNKDTGRKIGIVGPYMSLGISVHNVIEALKTFKVDERKAKLEELNMLTNLPRLLDDFDIESLDRILKKEKL